MQKNAQLNPNDNSEPSFKDNRAYFQVNKSRIRINYRAHHSDPDLSPSNDTDLSKDLRVHQRLKSKIVRDKDRGKKLLLSLSLSKTTFRFRVSVRQTWTTTIPGSKNRGLWLASSSHVFVNAPGN